MNKEFEYKEEYKYPTCACLNVTDNCNLACQYCFVEQHPHYMSLDTAKKAIDYLVYNLLKKEELNLLSSPDETVGVSFFGGEPTLLWDEIIVPIVKYTQEKYPKLVNFSITTNGTLLSKERIKFLKDNHIIPLLSIDGDKDIQDKNRPCKNGKSSFDLIEPNIKLILDNFPNTVFRATINQSNCKNIFEKSYLFALNQGFTKIFWCPNAREEWSEENLAIFHQEINKMWMFFILCYLDNKKPLHFSKIDDAFIKILRLDIQNYYQDYDTLNPVRSAFRCGIGAGSISISYDGKLFACQEQDSRKTNDYFYIGDIDNGINIEKHSQILMDFLQPIKISCNSTQLCNNCFLRPVCVDEICPSVSHDRFNSFFIKPAIDCLVDKWMAENAILAMRILVNEKNELFKEYLDTIYSPYLKKEEE